MALEKGKRVSFRRKVGVALPGDRGKITEVLSHALRQVLLDSGSTVVANTNDLEETGS